MLSGVTGQNDWWSQSSVSALSPVSAIGHGSGQSSPNQTSAIASKSTSGSSVSGNTSSPLAPETSFALMMFTSSQSTGGVAGGTGAGQSQTTGPVQQGSASDTQDPASAMSALFADMQSLFSTLMGSAANGATGSADASTAASTASGTTTSGVSATGSSPAQGAGSILRSELQTMVSDFNAIGSSLGGNATASAGAQASPGGDSSIDASAGRRQNGYTDNYQTQFAFSVYSASSLSGPSSSGSSLGMSV